jgi:exodeoxyribonuclease V alpha subunit
LKPESETDFYFVPADTPEVAVPRLIEIVKDRIPRRLASIRSAISRFYVR